MTRAAGVVAAGAALGMAAALAACSPSSTNDTTSQETTQDKDAPLTVWVDVTRAEQAESWAKAHPEAKITVETIDNTQGAVSQKVSLAMKAKSGVPDAIFLSTPDEISNLVTNQVPYALPLDDVVDQEVLDGFADGTVERCTFDGTAYCLPNDIGHTVFYYNKTLFDEWGYDVPETMDDLVAVGEKLADEHPGYSLGSVTGRYGMDGYFGSSECPIAADASATEVTIDTAAEECTRVLDVISPLLANGTLTTLDFFDPEFVKVVTSGKLAGAVAPSWMGEFGIKPNSKKAGQWAVAPTPTWAGGEPHVAGAVGGGIWLGYAGTADRERVVEFLTAMTSDVALAEKAPTYPASEAVADAWLERLSQDEWYAEDPSEVLREQAGMVTPTAGYVRYTTQALDLFVQTFLADPKGDLAPALTEFGDKVTQAAETAGYTVSE